MSKSNKRDDLGTQAEELALDALDDVMGGSALPMGLGGSMAAPPPIASNAALAGTGTTHGGVVGYHDHFGLHFGHDVQAAAAAAGVGPSVAAAASPSGAAGAAGPMGLGGNMPGNGDHGGGFDHGGDQGSDHGSDHGSAAPTDHASTTAAASAAEALAVNAGSAFQLLDSAAPAEQDLAADHGPAPVGLGGSY